MTEYNDSWRDDYDIKIWMNTIKEGRFEDTNKMFEKPTKIDYEIKDYNYEGIIDEIQNRL
jgi:adenylylsulfate kinase